MRRNLACVPDRGLSRLAGIRRSAHRAFARAAFLVETLAVTALLLATATFAIFQGNVLLTAHEWGLFLTHYAATADVTREPVDRSLGGGLSALAIFVGACRYRAARIVWRARDRGEI